MMTLLIFLSSVNSKFFQVLSVVIFRIITMSFQKKIIFSNSMNVFIFSFLNFDTLIHQMWLLLSPKSQFEISITYLSPSFLHPPYPAHEKISNKTCHRFLSSSQAQIHQGALSTLNATPPASYVSPCFVVNVSKLKVHNIFFYARIQSELTCRSLSSSICVSLPVSVSVRVWLSSVFLLQIWKMMMNNEVMNKWRGLKYGVGSRKESDFLFAFFISHPSSS